MSGENMPFFQKVLENNWLLLAIGLAFPGIFYFVWGVIDIFNIGQLADYLVRAGLTDYLGGK